MSKGYCLFEVLLETVSYCGTQTMNESLLAVICRYRRKRDKLVERSSAARIPTIWGPFTAYCYKSHVDGIEHIAMVKVRLVP